MKKTTHKIVSVLILLVSIFGLLSGAFGIKDALAVKDFLTSGEGDPVAQLTDGITQLKENEKAYTDGVVTYKDGVKQLADGAAKLKDGEAQLADGKKQLADGKAQLAKGYQDYADGQKTLAEGQKTIDANTAAYNEGKATLAKIDPIIPYLNQYIAFRDGTIAKLPGFDNAQEWFVSVVRPVMKQLDLVDIPDDVTDLPVYVTNMVKEGRAQLKQYEDGLKQLSAGKIALADGKKKLQEGEAQLADGKQQLAKGKKDLNKGYADYADGKKQLKEGRAQLKQFEDGMGTLQGGLDQVLSQKSYVHKDGTVVVASPADKLGKEFDYAKYNKDGSKVEMLDKTKTYIDLDKATQVRDSLSGYVDNMTKAATNEIMGRVVLCALLIIASIAGIIAGLRGLIKAKGFVPGIVSAVFGIAALIGGIATKFNDYVFLAEGGTANGKLQLAAIIAVAIVTLCFAIVTGFTRDKTKKDKVEKAPAEDVKVAKD